jgi:prepilin-type N-terminal cleavage/methylation domain-containing protein
VKINFSISSLRRSLNGLVANFMARAKFRRLTLRSATAKVAARPLPPACRAFSLVELLVVMSLLSLIVLALMQVFSATQRAFRAGVTQTDVMEGSRAAVEMITADLRGMTPSYGANVDGVVNNGPVNFFSLPNAYAYTPLHQVLPGSTVPRTNLLNYFFILNRENTKWTGVGYIVDTTSTAPLYPLYRYSRSIYLTQSPRDLFDDFLNKINKAQWTNMSHVIDGVVHLVVRPYDVNGRLMTNGYTFGMKPPGATIFFSPASAHGEMSFYFQSNAIPASVELEFGKLEDRAIKRAGSVASSYSALTNYLSGQAGSVHIFRQHIAIPNVDRSAYP